MSSCWSGWTRVLTGSGRGYIGACANMTHFREKKKERKKERKTERKIKKNNSEGQVVYFYTVYYLKYVIREMNGFGWNQTVTVRVGAYSAQQFSLLVSSWYATFVYSLKPGRRDSREICLATLCLRKTTIVVTCSLSNTAQLCYANTAQHSTAQHDNMLWTQHDTTYDRL